MLGLALLLALGAATTCEAADALKRQTYESNPSSSVYQQPSETPSHYTQHQQTDDYQTGYQQQQPVVSSYHQQPVVASYHHQQQTQPAAPQYQKSVYPALGAYTPSYAQQPAKEHDSGYETPKYSAASSPQSGQGYQGYAPQQSSGYGATQTYQAPAQSYVPAQQTYPSTQNYAAPAPAYPTESYSQPAAAAGYAVPIYNAVVPCKKCNKCGRKKAQTYESAAPATYQVTDDKTYKVSSFIRNIEFKINS